MGRKCLYFNSEVIFNSKLDYNRENANYIVAQAPVKPRKVVPRPRLNGTFTQLL